MKATKITQAEYTTKSNKVAPNNMVKTRLGETFRIQDTDTYYCSADNGFWMVEEVKTSDHYDIIGFVETVKTEMTYIELKNELKTFKAQGLTTIALNSSKVVLQAEFDRLTDEPKTENNDDSLVTQPKTELKLKFKGYVTAGDKNYIKQGLARNLNGWMSPRKRFEVHSKVDNVIEIRVYETLKNPYGAVYVSMSKIFVEVVPSASNKTDEVKTTISQECEKECEPESNIVSINGKKITMRYENTRGETITKTFKVNSLTDLDNDVLHTAQNADDCRVIFEHFKQYYDSQLFQQRYIVWCPSQEVLAQRKIDKPNRESYYNSSEMKSLLLENENQIGEYLKTVKGLK